MLTKVIVKQTTPHHTSHISTNKGAPISLQILNLMDVLAALEDYSQDADKR